MIEKYYIFTFGIGQLMKNYAIKIFGTYDDTREKMIEQFGKKWCGQYSIEEFERDKAKYFSDLKIIEV